MAEPSGIELHGTCIVIGNSGILLRGPPGAGKSDLALRLIDQGAKLVADDRVCLTRDGDALRARPPARPLADGGSSAGLIEARGIGIARLAADRVAGEARLALVCDLVGADAVDRLPASARETLLGVALPRLALDPFAASAPLKLRLAVGAGPGSIMVGA